MASERQLDLDEPGLGLLDGLSWAPLPEPLTSFVGREREREAVARLVQPGGVRLLTLTGPGGVGKTRLALRVARDVATGFADGVVFVPLAALEDPAMVLGAVIQGLGLRVGGDVAPLESLRVALRRARLLLVLDNMEQVIGAGPEVAAVLAACPEVTVLVTSRVPLHVSGEHEFAVPPLSLRRETRDVRREDDGSAHDSRLASHVSDAVELFVLRAREVRPEFVLRADNLAAVEEVCQRLDGLPLAIELAAARSKVLAPTALLTRLNHGMEILSGGPRDQPARLQTLRAAIAWSYDLLTVEEQRLFRCLGVFAGGFTLEAAEAVGEREGQGLRPEGDSPDGLRHVRGTALRAVGEKDGGGKAARRQDGKDEALSPTGPQPRPPLHGDSPVPVKASALSPSSSVLDLVGALVDSSLLRTEDGGDGESRFAMLETIRVFAVEQLEQSGEERAARERHAAYFLTLAEDAEPWLYGGPAQAGWIRRLDPEHDNLRAAIRWIDSDDRTDSEEFGLRLAGALAWFWYVRGHLREGSGYVDRMLAKHNGDPTPARLQGLLGLGLMVHRLGNEARAIAVLDEAMPLAMELGETFKEALALGLRGVVAEDLGNYADAAPLFDRALTLIPPDPALPHASVSALALMHRGVVAWGQGDLDVAVSSWNQGLELHRAIGDAWGAAIEQGYLGLVTVERGDYTAAAKMQRQGLEALWAAGAREEAVWSLMGIAVHLFRRGDAPGAARLFGAAESLRDAIGITPRYPERDLFERTVAELRAGVSRDAVLIEAAWAEGSGLAPGVAVSEALAALAAVDGRTPDKAHRSASGLLSPRELEVMSLLVQGKSDREIADALFISRRTAQGHVAKIFEKLGVSTRTAAATVALRTNMLGDKSGPE